MFLEKYFPPYMVTKLINTITKFRQSPDESLFEAWERYKLSIDRCPNHNMLPVIQIDTFYNGLTLSHRDTINATAGGTFMKRRPGECYDLIENMTAHHNDWDSSAQRSESSSSVTSFFDPKIATPKAEMAEINKTLMRVLQPPLETLRNYMSQEPTKIPQQQVVTTNEFNHFMKANDVVLKNMQTNMTSLTNLNIKLKNMFGQFMKMNTASSSGSGTLPSNTITNPKEDLKGITTRSGTSYQGPTIPTTSSSLPLVVQRKTEETKDTVHPTNNGSTKAVQPPVIQTESLILYFEPVVAPIIEPVVAPKLRDKANDQREKFFQIFKDLNFNISFVDALILMPKFGPTIKTLLTNKDKLSELARTPLNEHCLAVLLKMLPEKLRDLGKLLIPCDILRMAECLALADLEASINFMPLSVWSKLSLLDLSPMCMTLELVERLISRSVGVAEDVFIKVGTFHFPADFVVVDFDADPRVPLILKRSFLKTEKALIDVFEGELTLRVCKEAITFNLDQTSRYSANYNDMMANRIDVIDMACEEYSQQVLGNSDFLFEEVDAFLALEDDPTLLEVDQSYVDTEGDILILEAFLNDDPSLLPESRKLLASRVFGFWLIYNKLSGKAVSELIQRILNFSGIQELSYNQNYDGNYYSHDLPSFPCCDNYGGSHETFQCQPITFQINFSGSDQIQTPQYPEIHLSSQETSDKVFQANHSVQNEESSNEIAFSNSNQEKEEPPQDSDICQLIREKCSTEVSEEQKQSMEDTMLELVKICQEKEFLCIHDDIDDLIESALNSKLLLINSNSQRLDKK
nr:reverse transcriptase domain-containing protein [Tanacetum cinerariifolium]